MSQSTELLPPLSMARLRSGTAARLAGVPVATLRVWERRYGVVAAPKTATGQRLYSGHDVQRLRLIKQLTERGHAIGTIATLPLAVLQQRQDADAAAVQPQRPSGSATLQERAGAAASTPPAGPRRLVVVGSLVAARLQALPAGTLQSVHEDLDAADAADGAPADLLLVHQASLQPAAARRLLALAGRLQARALIVIYAYGTEAVVQQLRAAGARVRREPISAADLAQLVDALLVDAHLVDARLVDGQSLPPAAALLPMPPAPAPRHFSDKALAVLAATPSPVACECPRHLAEIVQQLAGFEAYSADCGSRSPADAALHTHLSGVAGRARAMFEQALLQVMAAEGIALPA